MARYAWRIDSVSRDPDLASLFAEAIGVTGPRNAPEPLVRILESGTQHETARCFRIYDDDGVFYYAGRILGDYDGFEPLDDFGTPNDGATEIRYQDWDTRSGPYVTL